MPQETMTLMPAPRDHGRFSATGGLTHGHLGLFDGLGKQGIQLLLALLLRLALLLQNPPRPHIKMQA